MLRDKQDCCVFIDGGYLARVSRKFGKGIDYGRFFDAICEPDFTRKRAYYFDCLPWLHPSRKTTKKQQAFYSRKLEFLAMIRLIPRTVVIEGYLQHFSRNGNDFYRQKQIDVLLSLQMVKLAWSGEVKYFVLVSGDSDFIPAVEEVRDHGGTVKLVHVKNNDRREKIATSYHLKQAVDKRLEITPAFFQSVKCKTTNHFALV